MLNEELSHQNGGAVFFQITLSVLRGAFTFLYFSYYCTVHSLPSPPVQSTWAGQSEAAGILGRTSQQGAVRGKEMFQSPKIY